MMKKLYLTQSDLNALDSEIKTLEKKPVNSVVRSQLKQLKQSLVKAKIVTDDQIPNNTISIHSTITLKPTVTSAYEQIYLVLPHEANPELNRISVLSPFGQRLLGETKGASFSFYTGICLEQYDIVDVKHQSL